MAFDLEKCARPNVLSLTPYRCARDDYADNGTNVLLDANENAFGPCLDMDSIAQNGHTKHDGLSNLEMHRLHRYPDPHQIELKQLLCQFRNTNHHTEKKLTPDNLALGVGSDETIDAIMRCFGKPGHDKVLVCPPTYGMYTVCAAVNDLELVKVPLDVEGDFDIDPDTINAALSTIPNIKLVYLCSPGNPTSKMINKDALRKVLQHATWNGIVIVDEAYIDFAPEGSSFAQWVTKWPNLVVMQTLSKSFGLAAIRLGAAFASPAVARLMNSLKAPYNISQLTSYLAIAALREPTLTKMRTNLKKVIIQRARMVEELPKIQGVGQLRGGTDANFLLVEILHRPNGHPCSKTAQKAYEILAESKAVIVRFRGKELGCDGCLRLAVGTPEETSKLLRDLEAVLQQIYNSVDGADGVNGAKHEGTVDTA